MDNNDNDEKWLKYAKEMKAKQTVRRCFALLHVVLFIHVSYIE